MTTLNFAAIDLPEPGRIGQVSDGIHWIRMPLPMDLDHINLWLLEQDDGFTLIDSGLGQNVCRETWEALDRNVLRHRPLRRIFITHHHPDHVGLAAWLQERYDIPVWMSRKCQDEMHALLAEPSQDDILTRAQFFAAHGVRNLEPLLPHVSAERYRAVVSGMPRVTHYPADGEALQLAHQRWHCLETNGHAYGHLCLLASESDVLIAGDQVLPTISPNIGLMGRRPDGNPLASYLESLDRLMQLEREPLVLPSHGRPFFGLRQRAAELQKHHEISLRRLVAACEHPMTAHEALKVMYGRELRGFHLFLAMGETIAHLEYLTAQGRLERIEDTAGVVRFSASGAHQARSSNSTV